MNRFLPAIVLSMLLPGAALAGGDSGLYVGAGLGMANVEADAGFDGDDLGYKAFLGYNLGFIPFLDVAVEGGYINFGEPDDGGVDFEIDGWDAFALAGANLGPIGVFGKAGVIRWDLDGGSLGGDDSATDAAYGVGIRFQLFSIALRAEYEIFDVDDGDLDFLSASAVFTF